MTPMPDLTEFLLARIAEDEAKARHARDWLAPIGAHGAQVAGEWVYDPGRVLAECDAKRRIVAGCSAVLFHSRSAVTAQARTNAEATMRLLALPYADHEGFREEWRP